MDDDFNMILMEGSGGLLNGACEMNTIEGGYFKNIKKHSIPLFQNIV